MSPSITSWTALALGALALRALTVSAISSTLQPCITFDSDSGFLIAKDNGTSAVIVLDSMDVPAIHIAASSFADDVQRVTGTRPTLYNDTVPRGGGQPIIVGTVGSKLIQSIQGVSNISSSLDGKWESYWTGVLSDPLAGVNQGLIIAGSDKRGAVFGLYELSEQMGVSPWYWWADVPVKSQSCIWFDPSLTCSHGEPHVKYRGFFLNDEQPALYGWAMEKFVNNDKSKSPFVPEMYSQVFELLLRLKANYLWPAMWANSFDVDPMETLPKSPIPGPNQVLADQMGIVMGTSHQEPMARNTPEWNNYGNGIWNFTTNSEFLEQFWTYGAERAKGLDTLLTMGMRGNGDLPLPGANIPIMENITASQQAILKQVNNGTDISAIPQLWCMYKEVMEYYATGLTVPDDITILLADDNWGNLMGVLDWGSNHSAGGGIYYHADYVGTPRDYKWINTVSLSKTWEQMNIASSFNTTDIWILNVGDLKPLEVPIEFFLSLAYDSSRWPLNSVKEYLRLWATREFGTTYAEEIADLVNSYSSYNARIKPELLNSTLWSLINYNEADSVVATWKNLSDRAYDVYNKLDETMQPAFLELVLAPVALSANLNQLYVAVGKANLHASQMRTSSNYWGDLARQAFAQDYNLTSWYHSVLDGKWNHMLDQSHINYAYWQQPLRNSLPPIASVLQYQATYPVTEISTRYTVENSLGSWPGDNQHNCAQGYSCPDPTLMPLDPYGSKSRWVDVASGGPWDVYWTAQPNASWLVASPSSGTLKSDGSADCRVQISVDWSQVPAPANSNASYMTSSTVDFTSSDGSTMIVTVPVNNTVSPPSGFHGAIEGDGYVVFEAAHTTRNSSANGYSYMNIEGYGRTLSGVGMFPVTNVNMSAGTGPSLSYDFWTSGDALSSNGTVQVTVQIGPSLNFQVGQQNMFAIQLDSQSAKTITPVPPSSPGTLPSDWNSIVASEIRNVSMMMEMEDGLIPGKHTIKVWGMTAGIIFERLWVDMGGITARGYSYLGPPESMIV